ncbi:MAG: 2-amino-4-hydroxy-6-hydroxymethyldihydropteridine diphosphokinase [Deltaproteobacteria bacterium]|jgi:2-amino-4-hydroxy-6-hydroxymethyldihydropteridine diphosphokinase|nr:2-amino-4-hydroxy-6-hydroxymethyldihydropteridine diphosphokinase [Deltaproteobacteria bacterium]
MRNTSSIAYISLGSNIGDSPACMDEALRLTAAISGVKVAAVSGRWRTEPQDDKNQPWFVNQAAALYTGLAPLDLLKLLQGVENALGRVREWGRRFGPRTIDLDILLYERQDGLEQGAWLEISLPELTLPHPRFRRRAFVLVPLREVAAKTSTKLLAETQAALDKLDYRLEGDRIFQA